MQSPTVCLPTVDSVPGVSSRLPSADGAKGPKVKFAGGDAFLKALKRRVDDYFQTTGRSPRDCPQMYFKTTTILLAYAATYALLVFVVSSWWLVLPLAVLMGLLVAAIGFNIQHDGAHKAYSDRQWVNKVMAMTLDLIGGSSYLWNWKHNAVHHTYTNVTGADDDINVGFLGRLSPHQKRYRFHRYQHVYLWMLYGFLSIKWHLFDDFRELALGRAGGMKVARPKGNDLLIFIAGKVVFFSMAFVIPMLLHPIWAVLAVYAVASFVNGLVLAVVFQLAHCVEEAQFPLPDEQGRIANEWGIHQVQTTADFGRGSRVLRWFVGGLNFQVEHHLFHKICHVHYPALSKVVEQACAEFGVRYVAHRSLWSAVASHFRWLRRMGQPAV